MRANRHRCGYKPLSATTLLEGPITQTLFRRICARIAPRLIEAIAVSFMALLLCLPICAQSTNQPKQKSAESEPAQDVDLINADRPGIADGSTVIGPARVQVEGGFQEEFRQDGTEHDHTIFFPSLVRVGLNSRWEARIEGNTYSRTTTFAGMTTIDRNSGFAPVSLGVKYQICDIKGVRELSLGTIVRVFPAWGSGDFHPQHVTGDVRLAADWNFAPRLKLELNPNIGLGRFEDDQGKVFTAGLLAITLNYLPTKKLNPFVDLGLQSPERTDGQSAVIYDAGVAYIVGRNIQLDASIGTGAHGSTPPHPFVEFGISFRSRTFKAKH
jgi:hypothetical protein